VNRKFSSLYERIITNTHEPETDDGCWIWKGKRSTNGYPRLNLRVPALGEHITLQAHIALWVWMEAEPEDIDEFYLCYHEFRASGLELDHACVTPACVRCVDPKTRSENELLKHERRIRARA
jgi:hypothetical protein